ncbi:MAG: hypothetical protein KDK50_05735 [Chlamydiia bacterium]|nr:hypothetical protein [Chlamydiia bacterium]MCP5492560.1 hypothetical protein [Chlamydiales bacterium]
MLKKAFLICASLCCMLCADLAKPLISWNELAKEVETWGDALGNPLDNGIKDCVIALNLIGFQTSQSCEGHADWGSPYPWVHIEIPSLHNAKGNRYEIDKLIYQSEEVRFLNELLEDFYKNHPHCYRKALSLGHTVGYHAIRLMPSNGEYVFALPVDELKSRLADFQAEMKSFTQYLIDRFDLQVEYTTSTEGP